MADGPHGSSRGYWLRYLILSAGLLAVTWAVVTQVLPPRLVPNASFRERAVRFSTEPPDFELPERLAVTTVSAEPAPAPAPGPDTAAVPRMGERGRLWRDVGPLLEAGRWREALPRLDSYLADHPDDAAVRLELARALARSGRVDEAEAEYRELADRGDLRGIVGLARLHWRQGRLGPASEQFRRALDREPDSEEVRSSLARVLRTMGQYPEAARHYRRLVRTTGRPGPYRVELARTLYWAGRPLSALEELRQAEGPGAAELADRIRSGLALPFPDSAVTDPLARARRARTAGDARRAAALYRLTTDLRPGSTTGWLEWADLLALDLQSPERAAAVLEEALRRRDDSPPALRRRLARYSAWAGHEERARELLAGLDRADRATPADLALLGDLLRWADERRRADGVYTRVLAAPEADSSVTGRAERGLEELRARDRQLVDARDSRRAGVTASRFDDSDGFARTGLRAEAWLGSGSGFGRFLASAGWYRLDGARVSGHEAGATAEVGWVRWLDHATARVELRAGRELRRSGIASQTLLSGDLLLVDRGVDRLGVELSSRPAHDVTQSLASLRDGQLATGGGLRLGHAPTDATRVDARVRGDVLHAGGGGRNVRLLGTGSWLRSVTEGLEIGVATRLLSYTSPAAEAGAGPGYWSPELSWTPSAVADWRLGSRGGPGDTGWGLHARLQPGLSVVREHGADGATTGSSVYALAGVLRRWPRATAEGSVSWIRSRAGQYDALAATLGVSWRF